MKNISKRHQVPNLVYADPSSHSADQDHSLLLPLYEQRKSSQTYVCICMGAGIATK